MSSGAKIRLFDGRETAVVKFIFQWIPGKMSQNDAKMYYSGTILSRERHLLKYRKDLLGYSEWQERVSADSDSTL